MRRCAWILVGIAIVTGCKKRGAIDDPNANLNRVHPDLVCPDGTRGAGAPPPAGVEVWCEIIKPNGDSVRHGLAIGWHENGQRSFQGDFFAGREQGDWIRWHDNGETASEGAFEGGQKTGYWVTYHASGQRESAGEIVSGEPHGPWTYWTDTGLKESEGAWIHGKKDGTWTSYAPSGKPAVVRKYRNGRLVTQQEL